MAAADDLDAYLEETLRAEGAQAHGAWRLADVLWAPLSMVRALWRVRLVRGSTSLRPRPRRAKAPATPHAPRCAGCGAAARGHAR
jgi:hypothetical protein